MKFIIILFLLGIYNSLIASCDCNDYGAKTTFVPLQITYDPVFEHALNYYKKNICDTDWDYFFSANAFFQKSVGNNINSYFNIDNKCTMSVREEGDGDIDSLWFKVISSDDTFYKSDLGFCLDRFLAGVNLYFDANLCFCPGLRLEVNTAIVSSRNNVNCFECDIQNEGTVADHRTVCESLSDPSYQYGRVCYKRKKAGLDDIQIKLLKRFDYCNYGLGIFGLLGIPTGAGTKSLYLFEPLVGTKNVNLGLGLDFDFEPCAELCGLTFMGELKYRYAFRGKETRSFDLLENGQFSRYLLLVKESDKSATFPAVNELSLQALVTPGSNLNGWFALHKQSERCAFELGYAFWLRSSEKVKLSCNSCNGDIKNNLGIADLVGISEEDPESASTANISQGVEPGPNQIVSDSTFVTLKLDDLNLCSAAHPRLFTNKVYASLGYDACWCNYDTELMLNFSYEKATNKNALDNVAVWFGANILF